MFQLPDDLPDNSLVSSERISWDGPCIPAHAFLPNTVRNHVIILNNYPFLSTDPANKAYVDDQIVTVRQRGAAAPTDGDYVIGDIIWDVAPTAGGTIGWVCITSGTPGVWKTFGAITA